MSFYIRKFKKSWCLYEETYENGKRSQLSVERAAYNEIGIRADISYEQAKKRVQEINREQRREKKKIAAAARRAKTLNEFDDLYFNENDVTAFENRLRIRTAGSEQHLLKLFSHFQFIQVMITKLKLLPSEYHDKSEYIFKYFAEKKVSLDYAKKLIQMANTWGAFVAKRQGRYFEPIGKPSRSFQGLIAKAQRRSKGVRRASDRLTVSHLAKLKTTLRTEEYNWIYISFWFGLRPSEVDSLKNKADVITNISGIEVLRVLQTKIESSNLEDAYKYIPVLYDEQKQALTLMSKIVRPTAKLIKKVYPTLDTYSGRKGFADHMMSLGQKLDHVSLWLGHKSLRTTLRSYKDAANVPFTAVGNRRVG